MIKAILFFLFSIHVLCANALATSLDETEDPIAQAVFADSLQVEKAEASEQHAIGLVITGLNGWGFVYNKKLNSQYWGTFEATYEPSRYVFLKPYAASAKVAYAEIYQTNRTQIVGGVERIFHFTQNKYWGFILGFSSGVNRSEYHSQYYRRLCTFYCGFDPRSPVQKDETDLYGFFSGRLGLAILETQVWGLKGNLKLLLNPVFARTSQLKFQGPDGREFAREEVVPYSIEGMVLF